MIRGTAFAKVNLGLRVGSLREDGFHPVDGIFQSIDLADRLTLEAAEADLIQTPEGRPVQDGLRNLAFVAAAEVRKLGASPQPIAITLDKSIPYVSGLGGGSADAAVSLAMAGRLFGVEMDALQTLAPGIGSDVPFCLRGGTARVSGRGELIRPLDALAGFALGLVVPPFEVSTPAAFAAWDDLGEPPALRIPATSLPPGLRVEGDLANDLYRAAVAIAPGLDEWRLELESRWGRPVMLSGSGPSLYGFFLDLDEAVDAASVAPRGARLAEGVELSARGWAIRD